MISKLNNKDKNAVKSLNQNKINILFMQNSKGQMQKKNKTKRPKFTFQITYYSK